MSLRRSLTRFIVGGAKGEACSSPSFCSASVDRAYKAKRLSFCAVFLDTRSAYYRVVRELAFGSMEDDGAVIALFHRFGVPPAALQELMGVVHAGGVMAQTGLGEHHRALVQDLFALSWFVTPYTDGSKVALSKAGSRPGESWADIVFAFVYSKVLGEIKHAAAVDGLTLQLSGNEECSPFQCEATDRSAQAPVHATWADDSVFFTSDASALQALYKAKKLTSLVLDCCKRHGMQPNMKRGKSAIVLALRGKHSRVARKQFFKDVDDKLDITLADGSTVSIFLEIQYTHLGTVLHRDGTMLPEAKLRIGIAAAAYKKYARLLLSNRAIEKTLRIQLFETLLSGVFYNLALWTTSCKGWGHLENGFALLQRRLLRTHLSKEDIHTAAVLDVSDMASLCRRRRLGFLAALVAVGDEALWALLLFEGDWARQICDDLRWLWTTIRTDLPFPDRASWQGWSQFILQKPRTFRALIRRAGTAHGQQARLETLTMRTLRYLGTWERKQGPDIIREVCQPFWCGPCFRPQRLRWPLIRFRCMAGSRVLGILCKTISAEHVGDVSVGCRNLLFISVPVRLAATSFRPLGFGLMQFCQALEVVTGWMPADETWVSLCPLSLRRMWQQLLQMISNGRRIMCLFLRTCVEQRGCLTQKK